MLGCGFTEAEIAVGINAGAVLHNIHHDGTTHYGSLDAVYLAAFVCGGFAVRRDGYFDPFAEVPAKRTQRMPAGKHAHQVTA